MIFDTLITGGLVVDGTGRPGFHADVGILEGQIKAVGDLTGCRAGRTLCAAGCVVCPGIIDAHCHTDMYAAWLPNAQGKMMQGVTTDVCGLCGDSPAPVGSGWLTQYQERQSYLPPGMPKPQPLSLGTYISRVMAGGNTTNMALFVGNTNLRVHAMGYGDRKATARELSAMEEMLEEAMGQGAFGLSTGLTYVPSGFADTEELTALSRVAARHGGIYNSHMRNEGDRVEQAVMEVIEIAGKSGCRGHISHLKASGRDNHGKSERCLELIHRANEGGVPVTFDVYPYTAGSCAMKTLLPPGVLGEGAERSLSRMKEPYLREKIRKGLACSDWDNMLMQYGADCIVISDAPGAPQYAGCSVADVAASLKMEEADAIIQVLGETEGKASMVYHALSEADLKNFLRDPLCMVGTDAFARNYEGVTAAGKPHPRNYGAFPRMIRKYLLEEKVLTLEEGIARMTSLPAAVFGIRDRGRVEEGRIADLLVFHPDEIRETGSYDRPVSRPDGIRHVLIGGAPAVESGVFRDLRSGRVLEHRRNV